MASNATRAFPRGAPARFSPLFLVAVAACLAGACGDRTAPAEPARPESGVVTASSLESSGAELLSRIAQAERETVFAGYKTAISGPDDDGRRTRMHVVRDDAGRTFMEWDSDGRSGRRWVYRKRHRWIDAPELLLGTYDVVEAPDADERVAWRAARRVEVIPRVAGRPSMTMLVDSETHLVLGETIRDGDGVRRFSWRFDTLEIDPADPPAIPDDAAEAVAAPQETSMVALADWRPLVVTDLPEGFEQVASAPLRDRSGERVYYSDGLAAFSVTQSPAAGIDVAAEGDLVRQECGGRARITATFGPVTVEISGLLVPAADLERVVHGLHTRP